METEDRNNLKDYLPSDISNTSYEAKITNVSNEIVTEAQKTDASYSYNVSKNGNIGNQTEIEFTIHSNNYEDITFKVYITLTDRIIGFAVSPYLPLRISFVSFVAIL